MTNFYDQHAAAFFASTVNVDMSPLYKEFLPYVPPGGRILDAGCGSGRDAKNFKDQGYVVTAIDASQTLCDLASTHIGQRAHCLPFHEITWQGCFDAVWACASLLHLTTDQLPEAVERLVSSLKSSGVMYCSFKWGSQERDKDGRHFIDLTEERFTSLVVTPLKVDVVKLWKTADRRSLREGEYWLNAIIRRR